jgi:tetratricopeptide (TPR) repeat protein
MKITIFLSYSWHDSLIADEIESILSPLDIDITRDIRNLKYKESLNDFMENAEKHDFLMTIVSANYLKSKNCMFECINYFCKTTSPDKMLPILTEDLNLSSIEEKINIVEHWNDIFKKEEALIKNMTDIISAEPFIDGLKKTKCINEKMSEYLNTLADICYVKYQNSLTEWSPLVDFLKDKLTIEKERIVNASIDINKLKTYDSKLEKIREYQLKYGDNNDFLNIEAIIHSDFRFYSVGVSIFKVLLEREPKNVKYLNNFASVLCESKTDLELAGKLLTTAIELDSKNINVLINLGNYYSEIKNNQKALEYFEIAYNLEPENPSVNAALGYFYMDTKFNLEKAGVLLEKAYYELPNDYRAAQNYGIYMMDIAKDYTKSQEALLRALNLDNNNDIILYNYGNLMLDMNNYNEAYHAYSKTLIINPQMSGACLGLGHVFKNYFYNSIVAEQYYKRAIQLSPENAENHYNYGILLYELKRFDEALIAFSYAIRLNPNHPEAKNFIGVVLGFGLEKIDDAIIVFNEILQQNPNNIKSIYNKAVLLERFDLKQSLLCYEQILEIDHNDIEVIKKIINIVKKDFSEDAYEKYLIILKKNYPNINIENII